MKNKILVIDSGIGGLTVLRECLLLCPNYEYIYFADYNSMPYGNKPISMLRENIITICTILIKKFKPRIVILACNTATATSIRLLRQIFYDVCFIGTEPAIKPCIDSGIKNILLLATQNTIKISPIVKRYTREDNINLVSIAIPHLANLIENNFTDLGVCISKIQDRVKFNNIEAIVLGCTHYVFLREELSRLYNVPIFDGNYGVAKQLKKAIADLGITEKRFKLTICTNDKTKRERLTLVWEWLGGMKCVV